MTVYSDLSRVRYVANGQTTEFSVPFPYMTNNDGTAQLSVFLDDSDTPLLEGKDYYIVGIGNYNQEVEQDDGLIIFEERFDSGTVIFYTAPAKDSAIAIIRNVNLIQGIQFINGEEFPAEDFSNALDKLTMAVQELKENQGRSVILPPTSNEKPIEVRDNIIQAANVAINTAEEAIKLISNAPEIIASETETAINNIEEFANQKVNSFNSIAENVQNEVVTNVEKSRIWAEGEPAEVETLGGELSSRGYADFAYAIANTPEDVPLDQSNLIALDIIKGPKGDKGDKGDDGKDGGGLEIGDVAFAVMGIDETKNLRRYLNGQVISQSQFVSFTNWVKERAKLFPNVVTTEENWQVEITNSKLGQCGKFVIGSDTIRLPKVVNVQGLQDLSLLGGIKAESLPNITGGVTNDGAAWQNLGQIDSFYGCVEPIDNQGGYPQNGGRTGTLAEGWSLDASRSSSTYQDNAPVQQEAIQYPYFIQVATGVEESVDVTREIKLNNPFSLLDYKWSEYELNNASWLLSNGAFHSGATYVAVYEILLKIYNGTETKDGVSVKLVSEEYSDTDFVLNTADTTFRLPVRTASDYVVESKEATAEDPTWYRLYKSGWVEQGGSELTAVNNKVITLLKAYKDVNYKVLTTGRSGANRTVNVTERTEQDFKVSPRNYTDASSATTYDWIAFGQGADNSNSKTYFYVGETIQDANVINASGVLTDIATLKGYDYVIESYVNGDDWYRLYNSGWIEQGGVVASSGTAFNFLKPFADTNYSIVATSVNTTSVPSSDCYLIVRQKLTTGISEIVGRTAPFTWRACGKSA